MSYFHKSDIFCFKLGFVVLRVVYVSQDVLTLLCITEI